MSRDEAERLIVFVAAFFISLLAVLSLLGCVEGNELTQGEVLEKSYDDPDTWTETSSYCMVRSKNGICMAYGYSSYERHDGPHWSVRVVGFDDEGEERTEWHEITETLFELADVGQTVNFPNMKVVPR